VFNVCPACGEYSVEKAIDPAGPFAVCPRCGHRHRFRQLPLFILTGASGSGKSAVCLRLPESLPECVVLETDILWRPEYDTPADNYAAFREVWLRMAKNVGQSGRPVVLGGTALPDGFERQPERRYFTRLDYLALVVDERELVRRLRERPSWRRAASPEFVARMVEFNAWLRANAATTSPPLDLLDTTAISVEETVERVAAWVRARLSPPPAPPRRA
jgi:predicted kinase